jgi:hypothetical protein
VAEAVEGLAVGGGGEDAWVGVGGDAAARGFGLGGGALAVVADDLGEEPGGV